MIKLVQLDFRQEETGLALHVGKVNADVRQRTSPAWRVSTGFTTYECDCAVSQNVLEVHDTQTRKTLHHLFYAGEEKKAEVPSSCIKLAGVGVVCGSEEYLLTHAHGCIRAGGVFYSTPDDVASTDSFDITEQAWELLGGDSVLRTQDWQD